ncbi:hypothetical protein JZO82_14420 [Vagococcus fluvialis]|jgi:hypothetical protein|uniref:hypothetical protein n=1 Tax=Vagococcus fluvialis TaxID=2738 RepID=UPI001A8CF789|nr:hypothetical protein [Vagococcus fluvialis]MBO0430359.1 hypothetical protein [Vagococcus fluvialis]
MTEVRFLKNHLIILGTVILLILSVFLYGQFGFLGKRYDLKKELNAEIKREQLTSAKLKKTKSSLEKMPELIKSEEIKGFTTSDEIANELTAIEKKFSKINVDVTNISMEEEDYFRDEKVSNEVIRRKVVTMDVVAASDADLESFIKDIEGNKKRIAKVKTVDYKATRGVSDTTSASVEFYMYYVDMDTSEVKE